MSSLLRTSLSTLLLGMALLAWSIPAVAKRIPIVTNACDTSAFGSEAPSGVTYNSNTDRLVIVDPGARLAFTVDASCSLQSTFSLAALGIGVATGIAHDARNARYAITDSLGLEVFFTTETGGLLGRCDLAALNVFAPFGIAYNPNTGQYVIVNDSANEAVLIDTSEMGGGPCGLITRISLLPAGIDSPSDIAYLPDTDRYAVVDFGADEVFLLTTAFTLQDQWDTSAGIGSQLPVGMAYVASRQRYYVTDSDADLQLEVDARGNSTFKCSTAAYAAFSPTGITYNPDASEIVFVDDGSPDTVFVLDADTCALVRQFNIQALSITVPSDIAYLPASNRLAITDAFEDEIFFIDYDAGQLHSRCDTRAVGLINQTGLDALADLDLLVVADSGSFAVALLDHECKLLHQHSTTVVGDDAQSVSPFGAAFNPGAGNFLLPDAGLDDVKVLSFEGVQELDFDTAGLNLGSVSGITHMGGGTEFLAIDSVQDAIYHWSVPMLAEPVSLSGQFTPAVAPFKVVLFERGGGQITGLLKLAAAELPVFGHFDADTGTIAFGFVLPSGTPRTFSGTVSADLNQIVLPPPLGTLTRSF